MSKQRANVQIEDYANYPSEQLVEIFRTTSQAEYPYIWHLIQSEIKRRGLALPSDLQAKLSVIPASVPQVNPEAVLTEIQKLNERSNAERWKNIAVLVSSVLLFGLAQLRIDLGQKVICLTLVVLVHEAGHILAMWYFKYKNLRVLMVPFIGAVAMGRAYEKNTKKSAIVALAGPMFGLFFALIAAGVYQGTRWPIALEFSRVSLYINLFNLLPIKPFDGSVFLGELFLARHPRTYVALGAISVPALLALLYSVQRHITPIQFALVYIVILQVRAGYRLAKAAKALRPSFVGDDNSITLSQISSVLSYYQATAPSESHRINASGNRFAIWAKLISVISVECRKTFVSEREALIIFFSGSLFIGILVIAISYVLRIQ